LPIFTILLKHTWIHGKYRKLAKLTKQKCETVGEKYWKNPSWF